MEEIELKLSRKELEHIYDALEIFNYVDSAVKEATGLEFRVDDPVAKKIAGYLGWSEDYCDKRSDEVCKMMDDYNDFHVEDELIMRQAAAEVEKEIDEKGLNLNKEQRFALLSDKYDEIREREGLPPKL